MTVRFFVFSFVLIKAFDCMVPSEAQPSLVSPYISPPHPTSCSSEDCHSNAIKQDAFSLLTYSPEDSLALWACLLLTPALIHSLTTRRLLSYSASVSKQLPTFLSCMALLLSLISGMVVAKIPVDLNAITSSWGIISTWYMACLEEYPVSTKSLTSSVFSWVADAAAQWFEEIQSDKSFRETYDKRRGFALSVDGMILSGPLLHYAFNLMEEHFPTDEGTLVSSLIHVFITDYFIDTIYLALSFALVAMLEGQASDLGRIYKSDFWPTIKASLCANFLLIPLEFICFHYLSVGFRVLGMNMIDIIWQAVVSFFAHRSRKENEENDAEPTSPSVSQPIAG
jgi:hypothetical protein